MSEQENTEIQGQDELTLLKQRAKTLGISFSNNISEETLRQRINEKLNSMNDGEDSLTKETEAAEQEEVNALTGEKKPAKKIPLRQRLYKENMRLIRVRITNLDPKKRELPGEIVTVANEFIGTVRKFIPFGEATDEGYHIPYCIYKMLKRRKFQDIRVVKRKGGQEEIISRWATEFSLEILPPLTEQELRTLASAQVAAGSVDRT